jgi:hypothetical protein
MRAKTLPNSSTKERRPASGSGIPMTTRRSTRKARSEAMMTTDLQRPDHSHLSSSGLDGALRTNYYYSNIFTQFASHFGSNSSFARGHRTATAAARSFPAPPLSESRITTNNLGHQTAGPFERPYIPGQIQAHSPHHWMLY